MRDNRERLAWTALLVAFALFLALLVGIPFGILQWIQRATIDPLIVLQVMEGTAQVEQPGDPRQLVSAGHAPVNIKPGAVIINDAEAETLLTISSPGGEYPLGTVQIYPRTELEISLAKSPRYEQSRGSHRIEVTVATGRIRLGLAREVPRNTDIRGRTAHAHLLFWGAGSYSLDVDDQQSQVTVREGKVTIVTHAGQLELDEKHRAVVGEDGLLTGPLPPERDLVANGSFRQPIEQDWQIRTDATDSSQSAGQVEITTIGGKEAVRLVRSGTGHAETGIHQILNQSLNGYQSLTLHLSARLDLQSLGVCGALGSECPLMIRIDYKDTAGSTRQWVQGFYFWVDPAVSNPTLCETCPPPRQEHEQQGQGIQFFYDSPNLMELLAQDGQSPSSVDEIALYASGHSYDVQVSEIELLVGE